MNAEDPKGADRPAVGLESDGGQRALREDSALERALHEAFGSEAAQGGDEAGRAEQGELQFGKYRIEERIGAGGMGEVFVAFDETLQRRVALKSILSKFRLEPQARGRFLREARALSALSHPGICQIHDYVEGPDRDWLVLEWIDGETLSACLRRRGPLPFKKALVLAQRMADALAVAHAEGIVHRDLKPGNIMVTPDGGVKILDFGLARSRTSPDDSGEGPLVAGEHTDPALTQAGVALGTLPYMSPEQARGETPGLPSDVFSLGLVLQEWFTGKASYDVASEFDDLYRAVTEVHKQPVSGLDRNLTFLLERMTDPVASRRPTAHGVLRRLRWIRGKPLRRRLWALGAAAVLAAVGFGVKYTIDIRAARDEALEQKGIAQKRAAQAETFLLALTDGGLREKLQQVGRTDILREFDDATREYFRRAPAGDLSDVELREHAASLYQSGMTRFEAENLDAAEKDFQLSLEMSSELAERLPDDLELLNTRGQAEFWVGYVHWMRGDPDAALPYLEAYERTSQQLVSADPEAVAWQRELSMARQNLVAFELEQGRATAAESRLRALIADCRERLAQGDLDREQEFGIRGDVVDLLGWLGQAKFQLFENEASLAAYLESLGEARKLVADHPKDQRGALQLSRTLNQAAVAYKRVERHDEALVLFREDLELAHRLAEDDPTNIEKQRELAVTLSNVARQHARRSDFEDALKLHAEAVERFAAIAESDPENADYRDQLSSARLNMARTQREADGDG